MSADRNRENPQISVIVPIYNREQYLEKCILSLMEQSHLSYEVILIDDGSTDDTCSRCEGYQKHFSDRIRFVHQKHMGQSAARNRGIEMAKGEYICFVDSDDYVSSDFLTVLYQNINTYQADVSICGSIKVYERDGGILKKQMIMANEPKLLEKEKWMADLSSIGPHNRSEKIVMPCNKMIRSSIVKKEKFPVGRYHEDEFAVPKMLHLANRVVSTEKTLYFYRIHEKSITGKENKYSLYHLDILDAIQERIVWSSTSEYQQAHELVIKSYFEMMIILYQQLSQVKSNQKRLKKEIIPRMLKDLWVYKTDLAFRTRCRYQFFLISPFFYNKRYGESSNVKRGKRWKTTFM